jgi:glycosyltransferase involved in cell wall biosynthesis
MSLFTVIVCTFNRSASLRGAIEGILGQTDDDLELIVVNDGSTDDTADVLTSYRGEGRLRAINRPNGGLSAARNTGLAAATGEWVIFLDDDDRPHPRWLETLAGQCDEDVGLVSCGCRSVDPDGRVLDHRSPAPHALFPEVSGVFLAGTFAVRRQLYDAVGGYAETIPTSHQTELMLRLLPELRRRGLEARAVDDALVDIEARPPGDRPLSQPRELLIGAEYLIEHHRDALAAAPAVLADYHGVAAVSAIQVGQVACGRRHFLQACRVGGWRPKQVARLALAYVPPAADRVWGRHRRLAP